MTRNEIETLVSRWAETIGRGESLAPLLDDAIDDRAGILERAKGVATRFGTSVVTVDEVVIEDDRVAWRWTLRAGDVVVSGVNFQRVARGRVASHWTMAR